MSPETRSTSSWPPRRPGSSPTTQCFLSATGPARASSLAPRPVTGHWSADSIYIDRSGPIGVQCLLNMHDGRQSASTGAGPPRAVAKLGLLNCYYWSQPILAKLRICQHSQLCPRRSASPYWARLDKNPPPKPERPHLLAASTAARLMCQFEGLRQRVAAQRWSPRVGLVCRQARGVRRAEPAGARRAAAAAAVPCAGGRMELNSLLLLLEAAEYLERRDRGSPRPFVPGWAGGGRAQGAADRTVCPAEAEHGYASVLPFDGDFARKKTKTAGLVRKAPNNRYRPQPPPPTPARCAKPARVGPTRVSPSSLRPQYSPARTRAAGLEEVPAPPARRHLPAAAPPRRRKQCHAYSGRARRGPFWTFPDRRGVVSWCRPLLPSLGLIGDSSLPCTSRSWLCS